MSRTVCSLSASLDTRPYHLHNPLPLRSPEYALSDRRRVTCVITSYPSKPSRTRRHLGRGDAMIRVGKARA